MGFIQFSFLPDNIRNYKDLMLTVLASIEVFFLDCTLYNVKEEIHRFFFDTWEEETVNIVLYSLILNDMINVVRVFNFVSNSLNHIYKKPLVF